MMDSDDMLSWLRSTIEGDKAAAEANDGAIWSVADGRDGDFFIAIEDGGSLGKSCGCCITGTLDEVEAKHIAIHDPRDTIARCEAELALLDEHAVEDTGFGKYCRSCFEYSTKPGETSELEPVVAPCRTVRLLACGYRHRPGFDATLVLDPAEVAAMLAGAEERRKQPLRVDDLDELQARLAALKAEGARDA